MHSLRREDPLEKEMATHSCTFAWTIPWTEEPGGLQSMGSQRVARLSNFTFEAHDFVLCKVTEVLAFLENLTAIPFLVLTVRDYSVLSDPILLLFSM